MACIGNENSTKKKTLKQEINATIDNMPSCPPNLFLFVWFRVCQNAYANCGLLL
jgi:anaerobic glycerol-3-phosphate dehydrogenase